MQPKFKDQLAWEQAEILMQPILIRVIDNLRQTLETSDWQGTYQETQTPYPGYQLLLTKDNQTVNLDIWQLCFQICFLDYQSEIPNQFVDIDTSLITDNEVNWESLESKTKAVIKEIFAHL
ncbi:hypothetical protein [Gloeocapsa sp. PCC 73106]|uniref:hypothetical protein n=1 Tax=Gloeocapsa sp. PCC 73106 TaxID=102232 RepID=UPI0002ABD47F|nr:hypothetical protein [Gloeocapsa sp. PCC 73106]ELR98598.1 hypothetical protein GLO73106DRAFT_00024340 [Gloeocapsa sp. PCC 73106]